LTDNPQRFKGYSSSTTETKKVLWGGKIDDLRRPYEKEEGDRGG